MCALLVSSKYTINSTFAKIYHQLRTIIVADRKNTKPSKKLSHRPLICMSLVPHVHHYVRETILKSLMLQVVRFIV